MKSTAAGRQSYSYSARALSSSLDSKVCPAKVSRSENSRIAKGQAGLGVRTTFPAPLVFGRGQKEKGRTIRTCTNEDRLKLHLGGLADVVTRKWTAAKANVIHT